MSENIFADLYNKVMSFFNTQEDAGEKTKVVAMSRLKSVLMQDRAGFSERSIQMLKDDMLTCISKYMEIEEEAFDLQISPEEEKTVLMLSIPVLRAKTDEEIDEEIKKSEEEKEEKAKEIVEQLKDIVEEKVQELTSEEEENPKEENGGENSSEQEEKAEKTEKADEEPAENKEEEASEENKVENPSKKEKSKKV